MSIFARLICKALLEYKRIIKRHLTQAQAKLKVMQIGLGRKALQEASDVMLYQKGQQALADINAWLEAQADQSSWYSGIEEFRQHLHTLLTDYRIIDNQVIHAAQKASSITVQALQTLTLPIEQLGDKIADLSKISRQIAYLGTRDQCEYYLNLLQKKKRQHPGTFLPLIKEFEDYRRGTEDRRPTSEDGRNRTVTDSLH